MRSFVFANSKDIFTSHFCMAFALAFALDVFEEHDDDNDGAVVARVTVLENI